MKIKSLLILSIFGLGSFFVNAQQGDGGMPRGTKILNNLKVQKTVEFSQPNIEALKQEDAIYDGTGTRPWRFGFNNVTALNLTNSGNWYDLPNGAKIWLLQVKCENALTVNLTFDGVKLPEGNELFVYNPNRDFILGKFTAYHLYEGNLGTELVPGNTAIIEYYVAPENKIEEAALNLHTVTHGYRTSGEFQEKAFGSSGSCNMNVNCPDGAPWVNQRNSAMMLVSGSNGFCSGALINNTLNDGKPYVLTANHCYSSPASWIFRFNWQAAGCPNPGSSPSSAQSLSGAVLRSKRDPSDFCLVEITGGLISGTVPAAFNPFFAGWDNSGTNPSSTVSIHHPSGDIKKISFDDAMATPVQAMGSSEANSSWQVEWDRNTTTEGGSSGSPLFDQFGRIIGQLWGGGASCNNLSSPDYYGRVFNSWEPSGSTSANQLKFWLDPNNTGVTDINGYDPSGAVPFALDASLGDPQGVNGSICETFVSPTVKLTNLGSSTLTSATITYGYNGNLNQTYNFTGSLAQFQSQVIILSTGTPAPGNTTFTATISNPNGMADENPTNNSANSSFVFSPNGAEATLNLIIDCYGSETTWTLREQGTNTLIASGGPYSDNDAGLKTETFCLQNGVCYNFRIDDSFGDGLTSSDCASGSFQILNESNSVLAELTQANANFGSTVTRPFCITASTAGIEEVSDLISVYPNPTNGILNYSSSSVVDRIEVVNISGQLIKSLNNNSSEGQLNISGVQAGMYFVRFLSNGSITVKQVILK